MADLWERLRAAKARSEDAPVDTSAAEGHPTPEEAAEAAPEGWRWTTPLVAERTLHFDLEPRFWKAVGHAVRAADWVDLFCLDTETTGLSGGAGTVAFLVGWARLLPSKEPADLPRVEVRQWFLRDHPGEADLIASIDQALASARGLVSFNGASFDLPLLRSRWALAGRTFPPTPHRDDLHPSRSLWKRLLDSCRLSRIEDSVLGIRRHDDVPGALVPALWFDYLRQGAANDFVTPLEGVLRHHAQDVYSLLCLDLLLGSLRAKPDDARWAEAWVPAPNRHPLARPTAGGLLHPDLPATVSVDFWGLLRFRDPESALRRLEFVWEQTKDETVGLEWADRLKRQRSARAADVWESLWASRRSYAALEEWLKWLEHRDRTVEARQRALELATEALAAPFLPRQWRDRLEKRRARLAAFLASTAP